MTEREKGFRSRGWESKVCAPYFIQLFCVPLLWVLLSLALSLCDLLCLLYCTVICKCVGCAHTFVVHHYVTVCAFNVAWCAYVCLWISLHVIGVCFWMSAIVCVCITYLHILNLDHSVHSISWVQFSNVCKWTKLQRHNYFNTLLLPASIGLMNTTSSFARLPYTANRYKYPCYWLAQPVTMTTPAHRKPLSPPPPQLLFPPPPFPSSPSILPPAAAPPLLRTS